MKFKFITPDKRVVEVFVVRRFPNLSSTGTSSPWISLIEILKKDDEMQIEPTELIEMLQKLQKESDPIPYRKVALLRPKLERRAKELAEMGDENLRGPYGMPPSSTTYASPDYAAYLQLLVQIGVHPKNYAENPEQRLKNLLKGLNLTGTVERLLYGYALKIDITNLQNDVGIRTVIDVLRQHGLVVTEIEKDFEDDLGLDFEADLDLSKAYTIKIAAGSPIFGIKEPKINYIFSVKEKEKKYKLDASSPKLTSPLADDMYLASPPKLTNPLADDIYLSSLEIFTSAPAEAKKLNEQTEDIFSSSSLEKWSKNNIRVENFLMEGMRIIFSKGQREFTSSEKEEIRGILLQKLDIDPEKITFDKPCDGIRIERGPCICLDLKISKFKNILNKKMFDQTGSSQPSQPSASPFRASMFSSSLMTPTPSNPVKEKKDTGIEESFLSDFFSTLNIKGELPDKKKQELREKILENFIKLGFFKDLKNKITISDALSFVGKAKVEVKVQVQIEFPPSVDFAEIEKIATEMQKLGLTCAATKKALVGSDSLKIFMKLDELDQCLQEMILKKNETESGQTVDLQPFYGQ